MTAIPAVFISFQLHSREQLQSLQKFDFKETVSPGRFLTSLPFPKTFPSVGFGFALFSCKPCSTGQRPVQRELLVLWAADQTPSNFPAAELLAGAEPPVAHRGAAGVGWRAQLGAVLSFGPTGAESQQSFGSDRPCRGRRGIRDWYQATDWSILYFLWDSPNLSALLLSP